MKHKLRITFNSPVILSFVAICFAATLAGVLTQGRITELLFMTYHSSLRNPLTYLRLITHVFGHSGWEHFLGNAMYLLILGPMLEEKYGSKTLLEVIGITALATGLINYIFSGILRSVVQAVLYLRLSCWHLLRSLSREKSRLHLFWLP